MNFEVLIGFDSRSYIRLDIEAENVEALKTVDYRQLLQEGVHIESTNTDQPLNICVIDATDEDGENVGLDHQVKDTLPGQGIVLLQTHEIMELVEAVESGTAYNSNVYNDLRNQLSAVDTG